MNQVTIQEKENGDIKFVLHTDSREAGEMDGQAKDGILTVFHTEIFPQWEGRGLSGELLTAMAAYARNKHLKVIARCQYVLGQFKKHPELYADIWMNK